MIEPREAETFERCMAVGGVAVFPADTVYGLACDPGSADAVVGVVVTRRGGVFEERRVLPVRFVPMTGKVRQ